MAEAGHSARGVLVAVEGLDGSGKSTQIHLVKRWLELEGYKVVLTEWNSSVVVKSGTKKGKRRRLLTPTTFCLIHCTDFADRYERQIQPLLRAGYIVLADRYVFTAYARDAVRGCDREWIRNLYSFAAPADITFFFDAPLEVALQRILANRPKLKYHEAGMDLDLSPDRLESFRLYQGRICDEYKRIIEQFHPVVIDATQAIEVQQEEVRKTIAERIDLKQYRWRNSR